MCQKLPRPRCSKHTLDKYVRERAAYEQLTEEVGARKNRELLDSLHDQHQKMEEARRDYNASPEGLQSLRNNIETAQKNRARGKLDDYTWQYEVAVNDATEHKLAGRIYDRAGEKLREPEKDSSLVSAYDEERQANTHLAELMNNDSSLREVATAKSEAKDAKRKRLIQEHSFVQRASGIPPGKRSAVETDKAFNQQDNASHFTYLPSSEFKKVNEYFPYGAYAKVEEINKDQYGNFVLTLEGGKTRLLPGNKKILAVS